MRYPMYGVMATEAIYTHSSLSHLTIIKYREESLQVVVLVLLEPKLILVNPTDQLDLLLLVLHRLLDVGLLVAGPARMGGPEEVTQQVTGGLLQVILNILLVIGGNTLITVSNLLCVLHVSQVDQN